MCIYVGWFPLVPFVHVNTFEYHIQDDKKSVGKLKLQLMQEEMYKIFVNNIIEPNS